VFVAFLLEQEGVLDDFMVGRLQPGIQKAPTFFQTKHNAEIAKLAMAQDTWHEKLYMDLRLYGKEDSVDHAFAVLCRMNVGLPDDPRLKVYYC